MSQFFIDKKTNMAFKALWFWGPLLGAGIVWWCVPVTAADVSPCVSIWLSKLWNLPLHIAPWDGRCAVQMSQAYGETQSSLHHLENKTSGGTLQNLCVLELILSWGTGGITCWNIWGKLKCFSMKGGIFLESFLPSFPQRHFPFGNREQLFFIQLVFNFFSHVKKEQWSLTKRF